MMRIAVIGLLALATGAAFAADKKKDDAPKWDVSAAHGKTTAVDFETDEGTWLDLDVSPDGQRIVFDPARRPVPAADRGGKATRLTRALAFDVQPRFSPDGASSPSRPIAPAATTCGASRSRRQDHAGQQGELPPAEQSGVDAGRPVPGGAQAFHFSQRSLGAGELWMYHVSGGDGLQLTKKKNDQQDLGEPAVSAGRPLRLFLRGRERRPDLPVQQEPARSDLRRPPAGPRDRRDRDLISPRRAVRCARSPRPTASRWPSSSACASAPCCMCWTWNPATCARCGMA
jgi:hypothetical protein